MAAQRQQKQSHGVFHKVTDIWPRADKTLVTRTFQADAVEGLVRCSEIHRSQAIGAGCCLILWTGKRKVPQQLE